MLRFHRFKQTLRRQHIVAQVALESLTPATPHAWLAGEMKHDVAAANDVSKVGIRQICPHEFELVPIARPLDVPKLLLLFVGIRKTVQAHHGGSVVEKRLG